MALNNNNPIPYYKSATNKSCEQDISFNTKEKTYKGLRVEKNNEADIFNKNGEIPEVLRLFSIQEKVNIKIVTEGDAVIEFENNKLIVKKTGSLTGLAIYYNGNLVELFTFIDACDKKNVGISDLFLIWKNKPNIIKYKRPENHEYNKYYNKFLKGGWFTYYANNNYSGNLGEISLPKIHDDLEDNLFFEASSYELPILSDDKLECLWIFPNKALYKERISNFINFFNIDDENNKFTVPIGLQGKNHFLLTWHYLVFKSIKDFKIKLRIADDTVQIPLNWSKLDEQGNPIEDFYGRNIKSNTEEVGLNNEGIQVIEGDFADLFLKGTITKLQNYEIKSEGIAVLSNEEGDIKVLRSGNLTGLSIFKDKNKVDYFSFEDKNELEDINISNNNHYLLWNNKIE